MLFSGFPVRPPTVGGCLAWCPIFVTLILASSPVASIGFTWTHPLTAIDGSAIPADELAFQAEYAIQGGPALYLDIPTGNLNDEGAGRFRAPSITLLCEQRLVARLRASWHAQYSDWSSQTAITAGVCPTPSPPADLTAHDGQ